MSEEPVSLVLGIVVAAAGGALFLFLVARMFLDQRAKRRLQATVPDTSGFDQDVKRYLDRIWLLIEAHKADVAPEQRGELDRMWNEAQGAALRLQTSRSEDHETAELVATLVELEQGVEAAIDRAHQLSR